MFLRSVLSSLLALGLTACATEPSSQAPLPQTTPQASAEEAGPIPAIAEVRTSAFPPAVWNFETAQDYLRDDPAALRFLMMRHLDEHSLVPSTEALARRDVNLGALLPLTSTTAPAKGLDRSTPDPLAVMLHFKTLPANGMQRDFVLDNILPRNPSQWERYAPKDKVSAKLASTRLGRLVNAGLISEDQAKAEDEALTALSATLPEVFVPPAAAAPKPKPKATAGSGSGTGAGVAGRRLSGGVTGHLVVIPSPKELEAAPLAANAKVPAGLHLMSMGQADQGERAMTALKARFPDLAPLGHRVERADLGELGVTYRLIAGPIDSADKARALCVQLKALGQSCTPTPF